MLDLRRYFVKEHVGFFKKKGAFDILDPETQERVGVARETTGMLGVLMRSALGKKKGPITITFSETEKGPPVAEIRRSWSLLFRPKISVHANGKRVGHFKKKMLSIGGGMHVYGDDGSKIGEVQGSWGGGAFTLKDAKGRELGVITKKWAGLGKELFTSADNYMVIVNEGEDGEPSCPGVLLLAAAIVLDTLYYDGKSSGSKKAARADDVEEE